MKKGWKKGTKSWVNRKNSQEKKVRLVDDLSVSNRVNAHPVSFKVHATLLLGVKSFDTGIDHIIAKEIAIKKFGKGEEFFKENCLHHDPDGSLMYVDKKLHASKRHLGHRFFLLQKARQELGL